MRRKDKEILDGQKLTRIIKECQVCRLGLAHENMPYIVPVCFGYDGTTLYFHTALEGRKIDILAVNKNVCFEFELGVQVLAHPTTACSWSFSFQSVIGSGRVEECLSSADKIAGLSHIMAQYSDKDWGLDKLPLTSLRVFAIHIDTMTGKQSSDYSEHEEMTVSADK